MTEPRHESPAWLSPLMIREMRVFLRSRKAFLYLFFFLAVLVVVTGQNWRAFADFWRPGRDIAAGARLFFYYLARGHLFLITFLMPILIAPSIVEEREKKTLDMLLSSPISVLHLVLAKLISPLVFVILLLTSSIPVLALCFLGGGLGFGEVFHVYVLFLATAGLYACLGLFCSTLRPRVYEVYLIAVALTVFWALLLPFHGSVWYFISQVSWKDDLSINHSFQYLSPFFALDQLLTGRGTLWSRELTLGIFLLQAVGFSVLLVALTTRMVRQISAGAGFGARGEKTEEKEGMRPIPRERDYAITFHATSEEGNPGLVLERRVQWFARLPVLVRLFYIALMISVMTLPLASYNGSWLFLSLPFISAAFFTLPLAATSISSDHERETLGLLRTTLLSAGQIVRAKFITSLQYSFVIALALYLPGMTIQLICGSLGYEVDLVTNRADTLAMVSYPFLLFVSLVMYTAWGLFCSAYFRYTNRALVVSGVVILGTLIAPFLIPRLNLSMFSASSYLLTYGFMFVSPLAGISTLFPEGSIKYLGRSMIENHARIEVSYHFTLVQCLFFAAVTFLLIRKTIETLENQDEK
ncbi:MAG TPA: ABC transporter permease [bacterium]|nr:ABC transporter permease [bacterium]